MKLSALVQLRELLSTDFRPEQLKHELNNFKTLFNTRIPDNIVDDKFLTKVHAINSKVNSMTQLLADIHYECDALAVELSNDILENGKPYLNSLSADPSKLLANELRASHLLPLNAQAKTEITNRISLYNQWTYPSLEIGCKDGEWTKHMVSADPLYIVDRYQEFIDSTLATFTPEYQIKLRKYVISDHDFSALPQEQFGFILAWNYLNYYDMNTIEHYLATALKLLRPGGVFMFSYNDADQATSAALVENYYMSYAPKQLLFPLIWNMGFEIIRDGTYGANVNWFELRKPGTLSTVKSAPVMSELRAVGL